MKTATVANWGPEISANHEALIKSNGMKDGGKKENKEPTLGVTCSSHRFSFEMSCDEPLALITAYATQWKGSVTHRHTHTHTCSDSSAPLSALHSQMLGLWRGSQLALANKEVAQMYLCCIIRAKPRCRVTGLSDNDTAEAALQDPLG